MTIERLRGSPDGTVRLSVLGPVGVRGPGDRGAQALVSRPKAFGLLLRLALADPGSGIPRDHLATLFWPESDEDHARGSLRQGIRTIRRIVGPEAVRSRGRQALGLDHGRVRCDALEFLALLADGHDEPALRLYRGDLAEGMHFGGGQAWEDWLEAMRESFRRRSVEAAWRLADRALEDGVADRAVHWGKRALGLSPRNELAVQRLMRLLDRVGDRTGALRAYQGLERWLREEYGVAPSPETRELAEGVRRREGTWPASARRQAGDRRCGGERRARAAPRAGAERRSGADRRRRDERRAGGDRRREVQ